MCLQLSSDSLTVTMSLLSPWLIIVISGIICVHCELEEYFKWKRITYASVERDGDDIVFPSGQQSSMMDGSFQSQIQPQFQQQFQSQNQFGNPYQQLPEMQSQYQYQPQFGSQNSHPIYNASNNVLMGASHYKGRVFLCVPRRRVGVPSTLNFVYTKSTKGSSPSLQAFPNQDMNTLNPSFQADPNRIISVYRTRVDDCNRLWWIDTGLLEYPNNATQVQRPSIWVYDLERDTVIRRFEIPQSIVERGNGLASITIDVHPNNCLNTYAYIPDLAQYRLYVYSFQQNRIWRFAHNYFHFDPLQGDFNIAGIQFQWDDGIFSITLGNRNPDGYRLAYFHPMVSVSEFAVSTRVLQDERMAARSNHGTDFQWLGSRGQNRQSSMHDYDPKTGIIFYTQVAINGFGCWNTATQHRPENVDILGRNNQTMIYPSDLTIDRDGDIWMVTNRLPIFVYSQLNLNEFNFRLWRGSARDLVSNSICGNPSGNSYN